MIQAYELRANGLIYKALIEPVEKMGDCHALGEVEKGYLVVCCLNGTAYLLRGEEAGFLSISYVAEKFNLGATDARYFTALLGSVLCRATSVLVDNLTN